MPIVPPDPYPVSPAYVPGAQPLATRPRPPGRTPVVAPILALLGLVLLGAVSVWGISLLGFDLDEFTADAVAQATPDPAQGQGPGVVASGQPDETPAPDPDDEEPTVAPVLVTPPPDERPSVKGTILITRDGDIWAASGLDLVKLTTNRSDTSPTWSPDGRTIYFIRTTSRTTSDSRPGGKYTLYVPDIMRMNADGKKRKQVYTGLIRDQRGLWFSDLLQLDASPDGKTLALVSDGPDGEGPVTLHTLPARGGRLEAVKVRSFGDLGHNDPDWSPDGRQIAYTHNRADGTEGDPSVAIVTCQSRKDCSNGKVRYLRRPYAKPSWSPDGTWLAAERTTGNGRDIVILDAERGDERARLTNDGGSFAPVVSPAGDQIAYLHREGLAIDLRIMTLGFGEDGSITLVDDRAVTDDGSIDAGSPPAWFVPEEQLGGLPTGESTAPATTQGPEAIGSATAGATAAP
jgi:hypothetical protein